MCHGSKKRKDATSQRINVDINETIIEKKTLLLKIVSKLKPPSATSCCMDLTATKTAAKLRYIMMKTQKHTIVM